MPAGMWCARGMLAFVAVVLGWTIPVQAQVPGERSRPALTAVEECAASPSCEVLEIGDPLAGEGEEHDRARALLRDCEGGTFAACKQLGDAFLVGSGAPANYPIALALYAEACDGGVAAACAALVAARDDPDGTNARNASQAMLDRDACARSDLEACSRLALAYFDGTGISADPAEGEAIAVRACNARGAQACALLVERWAVVQEPSARRVRASEGLRDLCARKVERACLAAAEQAAAVPGTDPGAVFALYRSACDNSEATGCFELGRVALSGAGDLAGGRDTAVDFLARACALDEMHCQDARSVEQEPLLLAACDEGDTVSCDRLADYYGAPMLLIADAEKSAALNALGCDRGHGERCWLWARDRLASVAHEGGDEAGRLAHALQRACDGGIDYACVSLGEHLVSGARIPADLDRAAALLGPQCAVRQEGCSALEDLAGIVPGVAIPVADQSFVPPDYVPEREDTGPTRHCTVLVQVFRGRNYESTMCSHLLRSIGSHRIKPGQAPWQALIERPATIAGDRLSDAQRVLCGGSLIAEGWILTAAHCLFDQNLDFVRDGYRVRLGVYRPGGDEGISFPIVRAVPHAGFKRAARNKAWDVALVQYDPRRSLKGAETNSIGLIRLDPSGIGLRPIEDGMDVYSYGWGWTAVDGNSTTEELRGVKMQLMNEDACARTIKFAGPLKYAALCAAGANNQQTCFGDSGGPLVYYGDADRRPTLIGVVSAGVKCGTTGRASQYTRVAAVRSWIDGIVSGRDSRR